MSALVSAVLLIFFTRSQDYRKSHLVEGIEVWRGYPGLVGSGSMAAEEMRGEAEGVGCESGSPAIWNSQPSLLLSNARDS
jgi:hypothetical protein